MTPAIVCDDPLAAPWVRALLGRSSEMPGTLHADCAPASPHILRRVGVSYRLEDASGTGIVQGILGEVIESAARLLGNSTAAAYAGGLALHAGCVARGGRGVLIPGASGAGKTTLTAWLLAQGFSYVTDELALVSREGLYGWRRPLHVKDGTLAQVRVWAGPCAPLFYPGGAFFPVEAFCDAPLAPVAPHHVVFPRYDPQAAACVRPLTGAQAARRLWETTANTARLPLRGFREITELARRVRAWDATYADVEQLRPLLLPELWDAA